jgi:hypothetical protein
VLESSRRVIYALQDFHKLVVLRQKKQALFTQFKDQMKEITILFSKLNKYFPEDKIASYREQLRQRREQQAKLQAAQQAKLAQQKLRPVQPQKQEPAVAQKQAPSQKPVLPTVAPAPKPVPKVVPQKSEIDQLNDLLSGIEEKLKRMG